jgi:hypothetical protein
MKKKVKIAFDSAGMMLSLDSIIPRKTFSYSLKKSKKFSRIVESVKELGLVALKILGQDKAVCLVATDDETFNYNHKVNHLNPIQEHRMILKAVEKGVSEERIAKTLNVDVRAIRQKLDLMAGICPEAKDTLKDKEISASALKILKKVKPIRQIAIAETMVAMKDFKSSMAKLMLSATPPEQLASPEKPSYDKPPKPDELARMEKELQDIEKGFKFVEKTHSSNTLNLVVACGHLKKLLNNGTVVLFLKKNYPDNLDQFEKIVKAESLDE